MTVHRCTDEALPPHDCFVTAANSFGMMTAGIDAVLVDVHGQQLMDGIQARILDEWRGEQPVRTGFGGVPFDEAARQMAAADAHHLAPPDRLDWDVVSARHRRICWDGDERVVP